MEWFKVKISGYVQIGSRTVWAMIETRYDQTRQQVEALAAEYAPECLSIDNQINYHHVPVENFQTVTLRRAS